MKRVSSILNKRWNKRYIHICQCHYVWKKRDIRWVYYFFNCCMANDHKCSGLKHRFISSQTQQSMAGFSAQGLLKLKSKHWPRLQFSSGLVVLRQAHWWLVAEVISSSLQTSNSEANPFHASNISDFSFCTRWRKLSTFIFKDSYDSIRPTR